MKKRLACALILFCAITAALFAGRKEIDDFLKSYEASVFELEELAKKPSVSQDQFNVWPVKMAEVLDKGMKEIERDPAFAGEDAKRSQELAARFLKVMETIFRKALR